MNSGPPPVNRIDVRAMLVEQQKIRKFNVQMATIPRHSSDRRDVPRIELAD
jgi:hypothetical protein